MGKLTQFMGSLAIVATLIACNEEKNKPTDTLTTGELRISVDETYQPVINEQLKVFHSNFPEASVNAEFKSENDCFRDLYEGTARVILVTRDINEEERAAFKDNKIVTQSLDVAKDAVAIIVHPESADSMLRVDQIKSILTGEYEKEYTVVFDNQGSSTVRYITDSLIPGQQMGPNVYAAKGNREVVEYVANNPKAIGFIGLSYVSDVTDTETENFLKKINVVGIWHDSAQRYYRPYQAYIAMDLYPFTRRLYYISRDNYLGLARGFTNFLTTERGQLIFHSARIFPMRMSVVIRDAVINNE